MFEFISSVVGSAFSFVGSIVTANTQQSIAENELKQKEVDLEIAKTQGATAITIALLEKKKSELVEQVKKEVAANKAKNQFYGMILLFLGLVVFVLYRLSNKQLDNEKLQIINNIPQRAEL